MKLDVDLRKSVFHDFVGAYEFTRMVLKLSIRVVVETLEPSGKRARMVVEDFHPPCPVFPYGYCNIPQHEVAIRRDLT